MYIYQKPGAQLLVGGPSGLLDFILCALRPCNQHNNALDTEKSKTAVPVPVPVPDSNRQTKEK